MCCGVARRLAEICRSVSYAPMRLLGGLGLDISIPAYLSVADPGTAHCEDCD